MTNEFASLTKMQSTLQDTLEELRHALAQRQSGVTSKSPGDELHSRVVEPERSIVDSTELGSGTSSARISSVQTWNNLTPETLEQFGMDSIASGSDDSDKHSHGSEKQSPESLQWELHQRWNESTDRRRRRRSASNLGFDVFKSSVYSDYVPAPWLVVQSYSFVSANKDSLKKSIPFSAPARQQPNLVRNSAWRPGSRTRTTS